MRKGNNSLQAHLIFLQPTAVQCRHYIAIRILCLPAHPSYLPATKLKTCVHSKSSYLESQCQDLVSFVASRCPIYLSAQHVGPCCIVAQSTPKPTILWAIARSARECNCRCCESKWVTPGCPASPYCFRQAGCITGIIYDRSWKQGTHLIQKT